MGTKPYAVLAAFLCLTSPTLSQAQTPKGKVDITFNGKVVTGQTQIIMIGDAVNIAFTVSGGPSVTSFLWQVPPNVVSGYQAEVQAAKVTSILPYLPDRTLKLYWIDQGPKKNVGLGYRLSNGEQGWVFTTFNVMGPTNVKVTAQTTSKPGDPIQVGSVTFFKGVLEGQLRQQVGWGEGTQTSVGIKFNASATMPDGGSGQFIWVQKIVNDDFNFFDSHIGKAYSRRATGGLDQCGAENCETPTATYQYATGPVTADSPSSELGSGKTVDQMSRYFSAVMYLMWQDLADPNSIPVTLGSVYWYSILDLKFVPGSPQPGWKILRGYVIAYPFSPSIWHPLWDRMNAVVDGP